MRPSQIDDRLVVQDELPALHRTRQRALEPQPQDGTAAHDLVVDLDTITAALPGWIELEAHVAQPRRGDFRDLRGGLPPVFAGAGQPHGSG